MGIETILEPGELRKITGKATIIANTASRSQPANKPLAERYARTALCMGVAYRLICSVRRGDAFLANAAYDRAAELINARAEEIDDTRNIMLADRVIEAASKTLGEYGLNGDKRLSYDDITTRKGVLSWAEAKNIPVGAYAGKT